MPSEVVNKPDTQTYIAARCSLGKIFLFLEIRKLLIETEN